MALSSLGIDASWSLFLDRDGVINKRLMGDYVKTVSEFEFLSGAAAAIAQFSKIFGQIFIVTNQQGIGKGLMTHEALTAVHQHMLHHIKAAGGRIDGVYYCPELASANASCRKPNTGMALQAQQAFPAVNFSKAIMVGDAPSDMEFGQRLGMYNVYINEALEQDANSKIVLKSLSELAALL